MPRISIVGSAAARAFGFLGSTRPAFINLDYMLAGGGGDSGGGWGGRSGGVVLTGTFSSLPTLTSYGVVIGAVASPTTFNGLTAAGGSVNVGDSGGYVPGYFYGGNAGTWGWDESTWTVAGGGGAGAGGSGGNGEVVDVVGQHQPYGGQGGPGKLWTVNGQYYGAGMGGGAYSSIPGTTTAGGSHGIGFGNFGSGSYPGGVIVSYVCPDQVFTGGTVTSTGSGATKRWFHTFATAGTLVPRFY